MSIKGLELGTLTIKGTEYNINKLLEDGEIVWFIEDKGIVGGTIQELCFSEDEVVAVVKTVTEIKKVPLDKIHMDRQDCIEEYTDRNKQVQEMYRQKINSVEDLFKFMFTHRICTNSDNTDYNARKVALDKAEELLGIDIGKW